jgi:hypothetical protein
VHGLETLEAIVLSLKRVALSLSERQTVIHRRLQNLFINAQSHVASNSWLILAVLYTKTEHAAPYFPEILFTLQVQQSNCASS